MAWLKMVLQRGSLGLILIIIVLEMSECGGKACEGKFKTAICCNLLTGRADTRPEEPGADSLPPPAAHDFIDACSAIDLCSCN